MCDCAIAVLVGALIGTAIGVVLVAPAIRWWTKET